MTERIRTMLARNLKNPERTEPMKSPITNEYLQELRQKLIEAEEEGLSYTAECARNLYRQACAVAYSTGNLVWNDGLKKQWELSPEDRQDGYECLALHRGKWRHVKWNADNKGWSLGYVQLTANVERPFMDIPSDVETDFYR